MNVLTGLAAITLLVLGVDWVSHEETAVWGYISFLAGLITVIGMYSDEIYNLILKLRKRSISKNVSNNIEN